ncbi:hypothetical protein BKA60DRAFT_567950 [Fusarium oxysporum]|nr:hypothetical protein DER44DRAFT_778160 [Fusarium oxysporum]KAH7221510.1 hypothetical protein BKA60DRAFT_567950 [Fusarium oxysporum]
MAVVLAGQGMLINMTLGQGLKLHLLALALVTNSFCTATGNWRCLGFNHAVSWIKGPSNCSRNDLIRESSAKNL